MKFISIAALISSFTMIFATTLTIPLFVAIYYGEPINIFCDIIISVFAISGPIYFFGKKNICDLTRIDGFILIFFTWIILCLIAAIPFYYTMQEYSLVDCIFEAISGLTTTGAEVFNNINLWPYSLKFYHQFLQLLGGLGIIVLGIAIMPLLGNNVANLLDAEHNTKSEQRLTPRISKTAKLLWKLYISMIIASTVCYKIAGLPWFDSVCYAFSTFSTGGFAIHSDSLMHYNLPLVDIVACCFAILGSLNFAVIFKAFEQLQPKILLLSKESQYFFKYLIGLASIVCLLMLKNQNNYDFFDWIGTSIMMITTTGLQIANFNSWPMIVTHILILAALIGGATGSTTGGIKIARVMAIQQEISCMFKHLLHPRTITSNENRQSNNYIYGFLALNFLIYLIAIIIMLDLGYNLETAFAGVTACLTNVGISINDLSNGYHALNPISKMLLSSLMLIGRLEATTIIVLLTPYFWREI